MTYNVFGGTLNSTLPLKVLINELSQSANAVDYRVNCSTQLCITACDLSANTVLVVINCKYCIHVTGHESDHYHS